MINTQTLREYIKYKSKKEPTDKLFDGEKNYDTNL